MDFDHVIEVRADGSIIDRPDIYAPTLHDGQLEGSDWVLLNGWSGQDRYSGPIMHQSEFIGGGMERYILATPAIYVSLVDYPGCGDDCEDCEGSGCEPEGWAVATREMKPPPL
jgi:hypothetical protein